MAGDSTWVESPGAKAVALCATLLALLLSGYNIGHHIAHYNYPRTQKYIFRILFVVPVYSICSCISVLSPSAAVVILTIRDVYEAFVVYSFLTLILEYAGGDYNCIEQIKHLAPVPHPWPLCCLKPVRRDGNLLRICKQGTLAFVTVKPIMAVISLVALGEHKYYARSFQIFQLIVYNITYTLALYCLLLFYMATRSLLTPFKPVHKFFAVKSIIFATYWQSVLVYLLPGLSAEQSVLWNDFILCVEMVGFAMLLNHAFPYHEFMTGALSDKRVLDNAAEMLSVRDVFQDAYHSFMPSYQDYIVARDDHDAPPGAPTPPPKTFRARTFLIGNLDKPDLPDRRGGAVVEDEKSSRRGSTDGGPDEEDWSADVDIIEMHAMHDSTNGSRKHVGKPRRVERGQAVLI